MPFQGIGLRALIIDYHTSSKISGFRFPGQLKRGPQYFHDPGNEIRPVR